jgi:hypothetical protein
MLRVCVAPTTTAKLLVDAVATIESSVPEMPAAPVKPPAPVALEDPVVPVVPEFVETEPDSLPDEEVYSQPLTMASMRTGSASARNCTCMSFPARKILRPKYVVMAGNKVKLRGGGMALTTSRINTAPIYRQMTFQ